MSNFFQVSSKSRYALSLLAFLASSDSEFISLAEISEKEGISYGYLEEIASSLKKAKMIKSKAGRSGGYRLTKKPKDISISEIIEIFEGKTAPVKCLSGHKCSKEKECKTRLVWARLKNSVDGVLGKMTLEDIL